ncbi:MAG: DUF2062 domain-containing protein [Acidobacteria bacterium]|nr:DUF2062 domain-containing protein [Acidobacteriota bacterium]
MNWAKGFLRSLVSLDDTPERIALGFAVGVFFAFSPLLGMHTFLGLLVAFVFGLNRVAVLVGVFINNPWTLVPIYGLAVYLGGLLVGFPPSASMPDLEWSTVLQSRFWAELAGQRGLVKPLFIGSTILSVGSALVSYPLVLFLIQKARSARQHPAARALPQEPSVPAQEA